LAAADRNLRDSDPPRGLLPTVDVEQQIERPCRAAIDGRRAARALVEWTKRFGLSEAEFQLLWRLHSAANGGLDQTALASALAFSPSQISATVERLRRQNWISESSAAGDRRRHHWQLSASGRGLLDQMLSAAGLLRYEAVAASDLLPYGVPRREAAA
jgi:DNA-binding MarR family transcriptional regulator